MCVCINTYINIAINFYVQNVANIYISFVREPSTFSTFPIHCKNAHCTRKMEFQKVSIHNESWWKKINRMDANEDWFRHSGFGSNEVTSNPFWRTNHRFRIIISNFNMTSILFFIRHCIWHMDFIFWHFFKFRQPFFNISTNRVVSFCLGDDIKRTLISWITSNSSYIIPIAPITTVNISIQNIFTLFIFIFKIKFYHFACA